MRTRPSPFLEMFDAEGGGPYRVPYAEVAHHPLHRQGHRGREVLRRVARPEAGGEGRPGGGLPAAVTQGSSSRARVDFLVVAGLALEARGLLRRLPPATRRALTVRIVGPRATLLDRLDVRPDSPAPVGRARDRARGRVRAGSPAGRRHHRRPGGDSRARRRR